jgi:sigma-E factor negative regulatory protein RseC
MITEQGIVEEASGRKAMVRVEKSSACATCQSRESCQEVSGRDMVIEVVNELGAGRGDRVEISIPSGSFLILSLLVYLLPIAALIGGAVAGGGVAGVFQANPTTGAIVGGFLGIAITFCVLKRLDRSIRAQKKFRPRMTRLLLRSDAFCRNNEEK